MVSAEPAFTACGTSRLHYVPARQHESAHESYASAIIRAAERFGIIARRPK